MKLKSRTRRDFLRTAVYGFGGLALSSTAEKFGVVNSLAQSAQSATDYRALVCIFLNGGNDSDNMIVPLDEEFAAYDKVRGASGLGLAKDSLLPITPARGRRFGLNPNLPELQALFSQGKLAVLCNAGSLVEPLTRTTYQNGKAEKPLQLFSHVDQINLWQTAAAGSATRIGWGGRACDQVASLNSESTFPQAISIAGSSLFLAGNVTRQFAISESNAPLANLLPLNLSGTASEVRVRRTAFDEIRLLSQEDKLASAAATIRTNAMQTRDTLASVISKVATAFPNTPLGRQLLQVARLISLRDTFGVKRQIFFCQLGGFDTHSRQRGPNSHDGLLLQLSQALKAFYDATVELGIGNKVTSFTLSEFGRTFQPAGSGSGVGTDHGWGGHQLILGDGVRGGDFYGRYPVLAPGGPDDADNRGRWIPTTSVEQYAATLATWYGVPFNALGSVFPSLEHFPTASLGFMQ
jgi:uncharacterized protein (DUF1501 family)